MKPFGKPVEAREPANGAAWLSSGFAPAMPSAVKPASFARARRESFSSIGRLLGTDSSSRVPSPHQAMIGYLQACAASADLDLAAGLGLTDRRKPRLRPYQDCSRRTEATEACDNETSLGWTMIGFQIRKRQRKVAADIVAKFRKLPVANISDSMSRMTAGGAALRPIHRAGVLAGPAFTVKTRPGDNLMVHKALDMADPGDVIVVDGGGDLTNSLIGELMAAHAKQRGIAGLVIYGAIRDYDSLHADDFPVFAA